MTPAIENIPEHLKEYITEQYPDLYTSMDHASWRYIMRVSKNFFTKHALGAYNTGIFLTGMTVDRIPLISEMDAALRKMGWRAVAVNGFIPPSIFMEFQSLRILAIACDMRKLENLGYTPSPDIVHEAAGHAPMIADSGYRKFLESYGEIARYAIINKLDMDLYNAIYNLSELRENPKSTPQEIEEAQKKFEIVSASIKTPSEAALLARMAWWTTEYGLIGSMEKPLIYGAGLLSSVAESYHCLQDSVKKIPFSLEAVIQTPYDITQPQPQLFVATSFTELTQALSVFSEQMAYRKGGVFGLRRALESENTATVVIDHGIQLSGMITALELNAQDEEVAFTLSDAKQIACADQTRDDLSHHHFGKSIYVPLFDKAVSGITFEDLIRKLHGSGLMTKNGSRLQGRYKKEVSFEAKNKILLLENVKITSPDGKIIFEEHQKLFPLIIGSRVTSVFGGAADRTEFALRHSKKNCKVKQHKSNLTHDNSMLNDLYEQLRKIRDSKKISLESLDQIFSELTDVATHDWLLRLELLELYRVFGSESLSIAKIRKDLAEISNKDPSVQELIERGMALLS